MTKRRSTKSALISALVVLALCFTALVGTTFAWFTDSEVSTGNVIQTGSLDVKLLMHNGEEYVDISDSEKPIFGDGDCLIADWEDVDLLWEPGKTQIVYLAVKNAGTLALKYNIVVDVDDKGLVGALDYAIIDGATKDDAEKLGVSSWKDILATEGVQSGLLQNGRTVAAESGALLSEEYDYFALAVHMKDEADDNYQDKQVNIEINLVATQLPSEEDSYDNSYDANAPLPQVPQTYEVDSVKELMDVLEIVIDGDTINLAQGINTSANPATEEIVIDKKITLNPNGMYLVSNAPSTFKVVDGGNLTVTEGSFTIRNTSTNGACVLVEGGEFTMAGGSFDGHTAVRTTEGKSSTVNLTAGWSNRVTVSFDLKGNDTLNVTGGSIYSSAEAVKTTAGNHVNINMTGGLLSSKTTQYSAAVNLQCTATVNMTGGKIENTYSSGYNGSSAIQVNVAPTTVNLSGTATLSSNGVAVMLGSHWDPPAVHEEKITFNMSGDSSINATSVMGFGIRYAQDNCDVTISGNARVNATYQAIQFNTNSYVYTNSTITVSENATITSTAGRIGGGYAIASNGHVTITGGTIYGSTAGIASFQEGAVVIVDNSTSGTPITINKTDIADGVDYTVAGNPSIG